MSNELEDAARVAAAALIDFADKLAVPVEPPEPVPPPEVGVTPLSCDLTNPSIVVNNGQDVHFGGGPYEIRMNWTAENGAFAGTPPVTGLNASVGTVVYLRQEGEHPTNVYTWAVPSGGSDAKVTFTYGEAGGGRQCQKVGITLKKTA